jgi:hypothetical protein
LFTPELNFNPVRINEYVDRMQAVNPDASREDLVKAATDELQKEWVAYLQAEPDLLKELHYTAGAYPTTAEAMRIGFQAIKALNPHIDFTDCKATASEVAAYVQGFCAAITGR